MIGDNTQKKYIYTKIKNLIYENTEYRDTKILNIFKENLSQNPLEILQFTRDCLNKKIVQDHPIPNFELYTCSSLAET
ncbi:MAG: hypothetical protein VXZ72_01740, partial [Chlamydiota bacterium]|nr:hypothetical protein [Chlamydiota bacterium]